MAREYYCFDLDGTLCTQVFVETRGADATVDEIYRLAKPMKERIAYVNSLYDAGDYIAIDTARGSPHPTKMANEPKEEWLAMTEKQLAEWGVKYHELRVGEKIHAYIYVDDRAILADDYFVGKIADVRQQELKLDMGEPYGCCGDAGCMNCDD
jgi:hypothetical protein